MQQKRLASTPLGNVGNIFIMFDPETLRVDYVSSNTKRLLGVSPQLIRENLHALDCTEMRDGSAGNVGNVAVGIEAVVCADGVASASGLDVGGDSATSVGCIAAVPDAAPGAAAGFSLEESVAGLPLGGQCEFHRERIHADTGERCWFQETLHRMQVGGAEKIAYILTDRTRDRLNMQRLHQALELAQQSNNAKSSFLAKMSHDIRTPINAIMGMTQIAEDHAGNAEKMGDCLESIRISSEHLLELINDVLDVSKIESESVELRERSCRLDDVLAEVDVLIRPTSNAKRQLFIIDSRAVRHRAFAADGLRLRQILLNLLSNAVKYTQEGGEISLVVSELGAPGEMLADSAARTQGKTALSRCFPSPRSARLSFVVQDNGMGIAPEFIGNLFSPFARAGNAAREGMQGTGLGMTITKALVDAMNGTIDVESAVGVGTTFTVTLDFRVEGECADDLPDGEGGLLGREGEADGLLGRSPERTEGLACADDFACAMDSACVGEPVPANCMRTGDASGEIFRGKCFLAAEDNDLNRTILVELLGERGAVVEEAENGEAAVALFSVREPGYFDAILMDAMMPVMDGYEAARRIRALASERADAASIPIIALTANAYADDVEAALAAGMNAHVGKPFNVRDLACALVKAMPESDRF